MKNLKKILLVHKHIVYVYALWLLLQIGLLIAGTNYPIFYRDEGFFPFCGFGIWNYGVLEFFIYTIALPIVIYIASDLFTSYKSSIIPHCKKISLVLRKVGLILLVLFDISAIVMYFQILLSLIFRFFGVGVSKSSKTVYFKFPSEFFDDTTLSKNTITEYTYYEFSGFAKAMYIAIPSIITLACIIICIYLYKNIKGGKWSLYLSGIFLSAFSFLSLVWANIWGSGQVFLEESFYISIWGHSVPVCNSDIFPIIVIYLFGIFASTLALFLIIKKTRKGLIQ